jgi:hypothetical protein
MLVTEYGYDQVADYKGVYAMCLQSYLPAQHVGWTLWVLAGSYYIRDGTQDYEETWGKSPKFLANAAINQKFQVCTTITGLLGEALGLLLH